MSNTKNKTSNLKLETILKDKIVQWLISNADFSEADLKNESDYGLVFELNDNYPGGAAQFLIDALKEG